ncbi:hypothetical protein E2C01_093927 [Portunus trituberculatus]|uniref:Uncharacterized protein n=1 Tax=Portunus trituberculatus TaxID=210409 RepID=A0A5B7JVU3_PORTR|nr:hypothetical protein [Portunus trituberculatus]
MHGLKSLPAIPAVSLASLQSFTTDHYSFTPLPLPVHTSAASLISRLTSDRNEHRITTTTTTTTTANATASSCSCVNKDEVVSGLKSKHLQEMEISRCRHHDFVQYFRVLLSSSALPPSATSGTALNCFRLHSRCKLP